MPRNKANDGLGEMDVEVVANDIPPCVGGGAAQQGVEKTSKVLLGPGVADHPGDFAGRDIETGDQGLRAVAAILEFAPLDHARLHRQPWRDALQCLTALRCDPVNPPLLGMKEVVSEDAVRRGLDKIDEEAGEAWVQGHLDYTTRPLLSEPWILDIDTTVKPLYGHQEGAAVSYNPHKPGRPSHSYHCYMIGNLRLVLALEVAPGNQHTSKHSSPRLWEYLDGLTAEQQPWLIRGDVGFGNEPVMREAERRRRPYLFKLRLTKGVKRAIERAMGEQDWQDAGAGWQGKDGRLRLEGWSRLRRIVILRRRIDRSLALTERDANGQLRLGFAAIDDGREVWEYAVLVTSLDNEILTVGQLYRDRADCENNFDELKNQWGWGGFTTRDLKRCRLMAGCVALVFNWWNLFVRLADPNHHREAITSRPLLLQAIGRKP